MSNENQSSQEPDLRKALFTVSDAVLGAAVLLAMGVYGGAYLDKIFHCAPVLSVGLALLGAGLGLARMVMKANALDTGSKAKKHLHTKADSESLNNQESGLSAKETSGKSSDSLQASSQIEAKIYDSTKQRLPFEDFE